MMEAQSTYKLTEAQSSIYFDANLNWHALRPNKNIGIFAQES